MKSTQPTKIIDVVIRKNTTILPMKDELLRQGVILEDIQRNLKIIAKAVTPLLRLSEAMSEIKSTLKSHSKEISMTQKMLEHHVKEPNAHRVVCLQQKSSKSRFSKQT